MTLYDKNAGTHESKCTVLKLWALEEVYPKSLTEPQISERVKKLIPEKFGSEYFFLLRSPVLMEKFLKDGMRHGHITKVTPFKYKLTEAGIARIRYIETYVLIETEKVS